MRIKTLFFDVGNTLLFPDHEVMLYPLHQRGIFPSGHLLQRLERKTKHEFDSLQEKNPAIDHGFWDIYYSHLLHELRLPDEAISGDLLTPTRVSGTSRAIRRHTRETLV